jgi:hypothetical protein
MVSKLSQKITLVLKLHILYLFDPSIFFQFNFDTKIHICYFLVSGWERKERNCWNATVKRANQCHHWLRLAKKIDFGVKMFHLVRRVLFRCFLTLKFPKKRFKIRKVFGFGFFSVFFLFFKTIYRFVKVFRLFSKC